MSGYCGSRMSNNAVVAYDSGEMPVTQWDKETILDNIRDVYGDEAAQHCSSLTLSELRSHFLDRTSWHHTGSYYCPTDFYSFSGNVDWKSLSHVVAKPVHHEVMTNYAVVGFDDWEGTRKHPSCVHMKGIGCWKTDNGVPGNVEISLDPSGWPSYTKRFSSVGVLEKLPSKPKKNSRYWKGLGR